MLATSSFSMLPGWILSASHLLACQVKIIVGVSGLCVLCPLLCIWYQLSTTFVLVCFVCWLIIVVIVKLILQICWCCQRVDQLGPVLTRRATSVLPTEGSPSNCTQVSRGSLVFSQRVATVNQFIFCLCTRGSGPPPPPKKTNKNSNTHTRKFVFGCYYATFDT